MTRRARGPSLVSAAMCPPHARTGVDVVAVKVIVIELSVFELVGAQPDNP